MADNRKAERIIKFFEDSGVTIEILTFNESTRTSADAAAAVGCRVGEIVKSLVLRSEETPLLFLVSGENRLNLNALRLQFGNRLKMADADFTRAQTGYAIGGVPPAGHDIPLRTYMDESLLKYDTVWAAAGTPHAVFSIKSQDLLRLTGAIAIKVG